MSVNIEAKLEKKILILVNPKSGSYRADSFKKKLDEIINRHKPEYDIYAEVYPINGRYELNARVDAGLEQGFRYFAAAGGDGTVAWLADKIKDKGYIGIIPTGTGNAIARILGIPLSIDGALEVLVTSEKTRTIDGMEINGQLYLMSASMGFTSSLLGRLDFRRKSSFGRLAYVFAAVQSVFRSNLDSASFDIRIDEKLIRLKAAEVMVVNTAPWGMTRYKLSNNKIDDGKLEVCTLPKAGIGEILGTLLDLVVREKKTVLRCLGQGKRISIQCQMPISVQADGDIVTQTPVDIKVMHCAATILVPE